MPTSKLGYVMLPSIGAMSVTSMCSIAWDKGYRYNWTRCDWVPDVFTGGQVLFTGEKVWRNIAIVDFTSMYPSIIRDGGISPECIDFIDYDTKHNPRFDYIYSICVYSYDSSKHMVCVGCTAVGVIRGWGIDAEGMVLVGECAAAIPCNVIDMDTTAIALRGVNIVFRLSRPGLHHGDQPAPVALHSSASVSSL
jgi:DNA polymerase elongation subunit (family B)